MEEDLKNKWKKVGKDFAELGKDFGKTLVKTVRVGVDMATEWADEKNDDTEKPDGENDKNE
jgi:hypothetical protein